MAAIQAGHIKINIGARFALSEIVSAHQLAESRKLLGAMIITP
jgi:NADPH2:quinone reductase